MPNIIFDMGNVLIHFKPERFIEREGVADGADRRLLLETIFRSPDWPRLDLGELKEDGLAALLLPRLPERLRGVGQRLICRWYDPIEPIPGMADLVRACKARGWGVYLLSNAGLNHREYWPGVPGSECFDGAVVSAFEGCLKPDPAIYRTLLARYRLDPVDCVFVDDMPANVRGATAVGMRGVVFDGDVDALRRAIFGEFPDTIPTNAKGASPCSTD